MDLHTNGKSNYLQVSAVFYQMSSWSGFENLIVVKFQLRNLNDVETGILLDDVPLINIFFLRMPVVTKSKLQKFIFRLSWIVNKISHVVVENFFK